MQPPRTWSGLRAASVGLLVACAAMCLLAVASLARSPTLSVALVRGDTPHCAWRLSPRDGAAGACVRSVGPVALRDESLLREVEYLDDRAARARWFHDQDALYEALAGRASITLTVVAPDGAPHTLRAAVGRLSLAPTLRDAAPVAFTGLALLAVGVFVLRRKPDERAARSLFASTVGAFACVVPSLVNAERGLALAPFANRALWVANVVGVAVAGGAFVRLAGVFPVHQLGARNALVTRDLPRALGVIAVAGELTATIPHAALGYNLACIAGALGMMANGYRRASTQVQALQARWMLWGIVVPLAMIAVPRIPLLVFGRGADDPTDTLIILSFVAFPLGIGVAILRERLFDIEVVVRRTLLGAAVTAAVLFAYYLAIAALTAGRAEGDRFGRAFVSAMVLTLLLQPGQARLEAALDRMFFRNRYDYRHALARLPDALAGRPDAADATATVLDTLERTMEALRVVVALPAALGGARWTRGATAGPDDGAWEGLRALAAPRITDADADDPVARWMASAGLDAVIPLRAGDAFVGVLGCSAPRGSRVFTREDLGLLRAAAAALALVVSRSHAFETIRTMNVALEETVRVRTQELEATRVELYQREKMSSLALLAAGVAHELNTPLGVVSSTAEQLAASLSDGGDARLARLASLCREASTRASDIVSNLRDFSRPGERYLEWGDLRSLVDSTLRVAGSLLRDHRIAVAVDLPAFPKVLCHPALLNQVLMNLVMNAVEAMGRDGALTITGSVEGDTVRLALDDTGPGVDVAVRKRIFEPFFTTKGQGTGLGLALCFGIVEMHRGRIWVETGARGGARFVVELPRDARPRP